MRESHRNLSSNLRVGALGDGAFLVFGVPPCVAYCQGGHDERQVEMVYAEGALRAYLDNHSGLIPVHCLDVGAAENAEAPKLRHVWRTRHVAWSAIDVKEMPQSDVYDEVMQCLISDMPWGHFDFILCVSTFEHCEQVGDNFHSALRALRGSLSDAGIIVLTVPVGFSTDFAGWHQFGVSEFRKMAEEAKLQIVNERLFRWDGRWWRNAAEDEVKGALYATTNNARYAAAVGAWTLCR